MYGDGDYEYDEGACIHTCPLACGRRWSPGGRRRRGWLGPPMLQTPNPRQQSTQTVAKAIDYDGSKDDRCPVDVEKIISNELLKVFFLIGSQ